MPLPGVWTAFFRHLYGLSGKILGPVLQAFDCGRLSGRHHLPNDADGRTGPSLAHSPLSLVGRGICQGKCLLIPFRSWRHWPFGRATGLREGLAEHLQRFAKEQGLQIVHKPTNAGTGIPESFFRATSPRRSSCFVRHPPCLVHRTDDPCGSGRPR